MEEEPIFESKPIDEKDIVAPSSIKVSQESITLGNRLVKSFFIFSYPRYLSTAWLASAINLDISMDISMFMHPIETGFILKKLRRRVTEVQSEIMDEEAKGLVRNPELETAFQDMERLRDRLQTAQEKMFRFALYITVYAENVEELREIQTTLRSIFESRLMYIKPALYQQKEGFHSCLPYGLDMLGVHNMMNTEPLSAVFPFVSFDLSSNEGIMYGMNRHNNSLILFDRFSMENANETIFATSGSGKSIVGSEPVLIRKNGKVELVQIGDLIENLIAERGASQIDEDLEGVLDPGVEVYSFNKNLKNEWSRVTVAARKTAPKTFYKFTAKSGREITTTGDHNMLVLRNGKVVAAKSTDVQEGEAIPIPRSITSEQNSPSRTLNLLDLLAGAERVHVLGVETLIRRFYAKLTNTQIDPRLDRYLYKYRGGRRISLYYFEKILGVLGISLNEHLLENLKLVAPNGHTKWALPALFPITPELFRVMGYIASEGTIRKDVVMISNVDQEFLKDLDTALLSLGVPFYYGNQGIIIASPLFVKILWKLGCNGNSQRKHVPSLVFESDTPNKAHFLRAYFEGDGGVDGAAITATSKSPRLISEFSYLLLSFGIIGRISKIKKGATNAKSQEKREYYKISISGQENLQKFAESINFVSQAKKASLQNLLGKEANTNVDVIPGLAPIFQDIDRLFGFQLHGIKEICEFKRAAFNPSRQKLLDVIAKIDGRAQYFKDMSATFHALGELPELSDILKLGSSDKRHNRALWQALGQSWRTAKNEHRPPFSNNALKMVEVLYGKSYSLDTIKQQIHTGFRETGMEMKSYHPHLQAALVAQRAASTSYPFIQQAAYYVWKQYETILANQIPQVEEKLAQLKTLASSELFWDPIARIEKIENTSEEYVYDLTVDNEVFLAGQGGMFVHNSYAVKLEILRYLMWGVDVIVLDPENEYKTLTEAAGGSFFDISLGSENHINPFDLPQPREDERPEDILRSNVINLVGLMRLALGGLTPEEDGIMDWALSETYAAKDITPQSNPLTWKENIPLMQDLEAVLETMDGTDSLLKRLRKFTKGTYANFFNQYSNISLETNVVSFGIREMEDSLRPLAIYIIMRHIWNKVRSELKRRIFVLDEAWWIMQSEDGASFLFGMVKRARKYWLGVTTITQDVDDFMKSEYGRPIVTNSSMQLLMKQSPASIETVQKAFALTTEEKAMLLETEVGEGIFIAGQKHVAIKVVASAAEHELITTAPEEIARRQARERAGGDLTIAKDRIQTVAEEEIATRQNLGGLLEEEPDDSAEPPVNL